MLTLSVTPTTIFFSPLTRSLCLPPPPILPCFLPSLLTPTHYLLLPPLSSCPQPVSLAKPLLHWPASWAFYSTLCGFRQLCHQLFSSLISLTTPPPKNLLSLPLSHPHYLPLWFTSTKCLLLQVLLFFYALHHFSLSLTPLPVTPLSDVNYFLRWHISHSHYRFQCFLHQLELRKDESERETEREWE